MGEHWFWEIMTIAVMVWYTVITVYVAYKGVRDIKNMLRDLSADHARREVRK